MKNFIEVHEKETDIPNFYQALLININFIVQIEEDKEEVCTIYSTKMIGNLNFSIEVKEDYLTIKKLIEEAQ